MLTLPCAAGVEGPVAAGPLAGDAEAARGVAHAAEHALPIVGRATENHGFHPPVIAQPC